MSNEYVRIVFKEELKKALDHFSACFGIRIAFFNPRGKEEVVGMGQSMCDFCKVVRGELGGESECCKSDATNMTIAKEKGALQSYVCHAGLNEAIKPIILEDELLGYIMMGQFRSSDVLVPRIKRACEKHGIGCVNRIIKAYKKIPKIEKDNIEHVEGLFDILVESTINNNYFHIEGDVRVLKVKHYIYDKINKPIAISEVAEYLNCSVSTLSHAIKKHQGVPFKQMLIEMKLEEALNYLKNAPNATVKAAALRVGYEDQYYFSRIFKEYYGISPSSVMVGVQHS